MVISTKGVRLFRFLNRFLEHFWSDKAAVSPKRILNVDLSYSPNSKIFFSDYGKQEPVSNLGQTGYCIEGAYLANFSLTGS